MKRRFSYTGFFGAVGFMVGAPLVLAALAKHSPAVAGIRPSIPLSMVRQNALPPVAPAAPAAIESALMTDEEARNRVVIQPLPTPYTSVKLENVNTEETASFDLTTGGRIRPEHASALENFFRCRRTGRHKPIHPGVLNLLVDVQRRWPNRVIEIVSGFRAPPYGAPHSKHFKGHAIDLRVRGVRSAQVRDFVWREHRGIGVGHYHGENFVHVDWRPGERDTAWSARGEDAPNNYRPRWARKVRHTSRSGHDTVTSTLTAAATTVRPS